MLTSISALASLTVLFLAAVSAAPLDLNGSSYISSKRNDVQGLLPRDNTAMVMPDICTQGLVCKPLTVELAEKLPGWTAFEKKGTDDTGGSKHLTIETNDETLPNAPAYYYVPNTPIKMKKIGLPECVKSTQTTSGTMAGASGVATLSTLSGYQYGITATVMETSSIGLTDTMTLSLSFDGVVDGGSIASATVSISNSLTRSDTKTLSNLNSETVTVNAPKDSKCSIDQVVNTCTYATTGKVQFISGGKVWFDHTSVVENKAAPNEGKHRKWSFDLDTLDLASRSTSMTISGSLSVDTRGSYTSKCVNTTTTG
ncbi:hypothetical protein BT96DRAFT_1021122 [Gymnopus androsaceus JB14]|uniref:Uncharacterized protein n=1 Tax=Gymnopus androsaceus JB14 TaxID=1447944 RepID=A0A6A4HI89_9AGAR|nr:hypothetical protein BT96DRAFT_1021122 [Gymnopus androsaceus JB14]